MAKEYHAAMVVIGNEILSGRTQDKNINYVAKKLVEKGIALREVRIIPDVEKTVISVLKELKGKYDYIFTSGGIGPTHDDITAECVAKTCSTHLEENKEAYQILLDYYGKDELTQARLKMAQIPVGASLIPNPVSAAPGFVIENIHVMAGVPRIMQAMLDHVVSELAGGDAVLSVSIPCTLPESKIAHDLGEIQNKFPHVEIGSYPHFQEGALGVNIVLRSSNEEALSQVKEHVEAMILTLSQAV